MNPEINEVILRSKQNKEPMDFERFKFFCNFISGIIAEVLGFTLAIIIVLCMAGVLR